MVEQKAVFLIYLVITLIFVLYQPTPVSAQQACCEKTTGGEYCSFVDESNCALGFRSSYSSCDSTSYCAPVCCVGSDSNCVSGVGQAQCVSQGGRSDSDVTCNSVSLCEVGCCVLGGQCGYMNKGECNELSNSFSGASSDFRGGLDELSCSNLCSSAGNLGACLVGDTCTYVSQLDCAGDFYSARSCSSLDGCVDCEAHSYQGCNDGDVYWFDSHGNREELVEECSYYDGFICKSDDNNYNAECKSINCQPTVYSDLNYTLTEKKNGESWCVYESPVGDFLDRPGTRHVRVKCENGEEVTEPCRDYRDEVCLQFYDNVSEVYVSSCERNEIYSSLFHSEILTVDRGFNFWEPPPESVEGEDELELDDEKHGSLKCNDASSNCMVVYLKKNIFSSLKCVGNCYCETQDFIDQAAGICKQYGDCGADVNILGEKSEEGLKVEWVGTNKGPRPYKVSEQYWNELDLNGIHGGLFNISEMISQVTGATHDARAYEGFANTIERTLYAESSAQFLLFTPGYLVYFGPYGVIASAVASVLQIVVGKIIGGSKIRTKTVTINCNSWKAPEGGSNCERCADDINFPCTEYKCKSLGTACDIINEDSEFVECVEKPGDDHLPVVIIPNITGHQISETDNGFEFVNLVDPYQVTLGLNTNKYAICHFDEESKDFEDMRYSFSNEQNYIPYVLEHEVSLSVFRNKDYEYYIRCEDEFGNTNPIDYKIKFKGSNAFDIQVPNILGYDPLNGGVIKNNDNQSILTLRLDEPSNCKYDILDKPYENMTFEFVCGEVEDSLTIVGDVGFECVNALTDLQVGPNKYYIRCQDSVNNTFTNSRLYSVSRTEALNVELRNPQDQDELYSNNLMISVSTTGGVDGKAVCKYGYSNVDYEQMIEFTNTGEASHTAPQTLGHGRYNYYVICRDSVGNEDKLKFGFKIMVDELNPKIVQIFRDSSYLYVILNVDASCEVGNGQFVYGDGRAMAKVDNQHKAGLIGSVNHINCVDSNNNVIVSQRVIV